MPRGPRMIYDDAILNIASRGNNKRKIFRRSADYRRFTNTLLKYKHKFGFKIFHYCLMPNHVHLLMRIKDAASLAKSMKSLQLSYFSYYDKKYGYVGRFWQGRFHSKLVEDDSYLLTAGLYIERNPVRAGLVKDPSKYKWSSYNVYAYGVRDPLVDIDPDYASLSSDDKERQAAYREIMRNYAGLHQN